MRGAVLAMGNVDNPYMRPRGEMAEGEQVYARLTFCPHCGAHQHHTIKRIQGVWFWLRCRRCGREYKVRSKAQ